MVDQSPVTEKDNQQVDPWCQHVATFRVSETQVTAVPEGGSIIVQHGLTVVVAEGRQEVLWDEDPNRPPRSTLEYFCRITMEGAAEPDFWSGDEAQIVVAGKHENGSRITIAGPGAIGRDDKGSLEIEFEKAPQMAVVLPET